MELCIALLAGIIIGAAMYQVATRTTEKRPSALGDLRDSVKENGEAFQLLITEAHAAHRAANRSLSERVARLQLERDHFFTVAHDLTRKLEGAHASPPDPPKEQPQDGVQAFENHLNALTGGRTPQLDNVEQ